MLTFNVFHNCGWIGSGGRQPISPVSDNSQNADNLRAFQQAMDQANLLPPGPLNAGPPDEPTTTEALIRREYAPDAAPESDIKILLPPGARG